MISKKNVFFQCLILILSGWFLSADLDASSSWSSRYNKTKAKNRYSSNRYSKASPNRDSSSNRYGSSNKTSYSGKTTEEIMGEVYLRAGELSEDIALSLSEMADFPQMLLNIRDQIEQLHKNNSTRRMVYSRYKGIFRSQLNRTQNKTVKDFLKNLEKLILEAAKYELYENTTLAHEINDDEFISFQNEKHNIGKNSEIETITNNQIKRELLNVLDDNVSDCFEGGIERVKCFNDFKVRFKKIQETFKSDHNKEIMRHLIERHRDNINRIIPRHTLPLIDEIIQSNRALFSLISPRSEEIAKMPSKDDKQSEFSEHFYQPYSIVGSDLSPPSPIAEGALRTSLESTSAYDPYGLEIKQLTAERKKAQKTEEAEEKKKKEKGGIASEIKEQLVEKGKATAKDAGSKIFEKLGSFLTKSIDKALTPVP